MNNATPDKAKDPAWQQWAEHEAAVLNGEQPPLSEPALERLRKQRDEVKGRESSLGKAAGMKWAQMKADFAELQIIVNANFSCEPELAAYDITNEIGCDVYSVFNHEEELTTSYLEGWLEGVQYVFDAI